MREHLRSVLSPRRLIALLSSIVVSLCSGTNYVFSAYAPQLGSRLRITHTKLNIIGLAGNIGVYGSGVFFGRVVDRKGHRILLACAFVLLFVGYAGIRHFYNSAPADIGATTQGEGISHVAFVTLIVCSLMTGLGSNAGLSSSVNAVANSFPDALRASVTGVVISGFGLSAFLFSTLAHVMYPGDASSFLLLLALGTSLPMILGFFFVRPIPLPVAGAASVDIEGDRGSSSVPTLDDTNSIGSAATYQDQSFALTLTRSNESTSEADQVKSSTTRIHETVRDVSGKALLLKSDFWLLSVLMALLSGTGIMYINNVGSIAQALCAKNNPDFDPVESAKWQNLQVSIISIANCVGRILSGIGADVVKNRLQRPRSFGLSFISSLFVLSQIVASRIDRVQDLWWASALLGLAYGSMFGVYPTLVIEWFGLPHFSENWGYVSLSPMVGGNLFSLAFGRNLDAHAEHPHVTSALRAGEQCYAGRNCYVASLYLTMIACLLAVFLSLLAARKDHKRMGGSLADYQEIPQDSQ